jgi:putative membrane protein
MIMGGGLMMLARILFWIALGVGIYLIVSHFYGPRSRITPTGNDQALTIARERYARGEITQKEFEEIRRNLQQ